MISKLVQQKLTIAGKEYEYPDTTALVGKINELADAVNELQENQNTYWTDIAEIKKELQTRAENVQEDTKSRQENVQPDYVTTSYLTDGHTEEYYGQNGASVVIDHPLPAGYVITIRESEIKGGDND